MRTILRWLVGLTFVFTGVLKLALPYLQAYLPPGSPPDFPTVLTAAGVPFPVLTAYAVCALEVVAGGCLVAGKVVRLAALALAGSMVGALATVGVPAVIGRPMQINGQPFGTEPWRIPAELGLLAACVYLALTKEPKKGKH